MAESPSSSTMRPREVMPFPVTQSRPNAQAGEPAANSVRPALLDGEPGLCKHPEQRVGREKEYVPRLTKRDLAAVPIKFK